MELIQAYLYRIPNVFEAEFNKLKRKHDGQKDHWITKEGIKLYPFQMTDSHLLQVLRYLEKRSANRHLYGLMKIEAKKRKLI
jgi:hypothetical protein